MAFALAKDMPEVTTVILRFCKVYYIGDDKQHITRHEIIDLVSIGGCFVGLTIGGLQVGIIFWKEGYPSFFT